MLNNGIDVTALHNHFFWDDPHVYYMHVHGMGKAADLAQRVKPGLDLIGHVKPESPASPNSAGAPLDTAGLAKLVGHEGEQTGPDYKITVGRDDLGMKEHGAVINARMGLNTWAAFVGTQENAAIAGDVAMLESELTPVLKALSRNGLNVVAIHHHMTGDHPMVIFLHYWGRGPADRLATGFKAALNELGKAPRYTTWLPEGTAAPICFPRSSALLCRGSRQSHQHLQKIGPRLEENRPPPGTKCRNALFTPNDRKG